MRQHSLTAFVSGFAVMGAELAISRLVAPYFGTSTPVWATLIGLVLGSLAIGSLLGGRLAHRRGILEHAFVGMAVAGAILAFLPALGRPLMRGTLAHFQHGEYAILAASLLVVLAILALPVILLGALTPILVHTASVDAKHVGAISGRLGAMSTLGSLTGTFVSGLVLVPLFGTNFTFLLCGACCVTLGIFGSARRVRMLAPLAGAGIALLAPNPRVHDGSARFEAETPYNYLRVVERKGERSLELNEGFATQTVMRLDGKPVLHGVWGYYALAPAFAQKRPQRILVLGLGGGMSARRFAETEPGAEVVAVEVDPGIAQVARSHFGLPSSVEVHVQDARAFLATDARRYDVVLIDAFQFPYVPFQLTTQEFFQSVREHLAPGGAVMVNVGRKGNHREVVSAVATTLQSVFSRVDGVDVAHATNSILVAADHAASTDLGLAGLGLPGGDVAALQRLRTLAPMQVPASEALLLTDDRAPIEWLTNLIVWREITS